MTTYIALLRAVNVGGTGKLPMADLKTMCAELGFTQVTTVIASGNVVFQSEASAAQVTFGLEAKLLAYAGKPIGVMVRTALQLDAVLSANPFKHYVASQVLTVFISEAPTPAALLSVKGQKNEMLALGEREIYVYYADGMGASKLQITAAQSGTARNMNTLAKLLEIANRLSRSGTL